MLPSARYVTQSGVYSQMFISGPLTDKAIIKYAASGRYGPEMQRRFAPPKKKKRNFKPKQAKKLTRVAQLLALYD